MRRRLLASTLPHHVDGFIVPVNHVKPEVPDIEDAGCLVQEFSLMEGLQALLSQFKFPSGSVMVRLYARDCGELRSPADKAIVLCHGQVNQVATVGHANGFDDCG